MKLMFDSNYPIVFLRDSLPVVYGLYAKFYKLNQLAVFLNLRNHFVVTLESKEMKSAMLVY